MKATKILALILSLVTLSCIFISCDQEDLDNIEIPDPTIYTATVSFQIKDSDGRIIVDAENYKYEWIKEPTILNIIDTYLAIDADYKCTIDEDTGLLQQVGNVKARRDDYWAYTMGVNLDSTELTPQDGSMSAEVIENGGKFTVFLVEVSD